VETNLGNAADIDACAHPDSIHNRPIDTRQPIMRDFRIRTGLYGRP
jgi:hypothetical protein